MGSSSKSKNKGGDIIVQGSILAADRSCPPDWAVLPYSAPANLQEMLRWGITATHMIFICYCCLFRPMVYRWQFSKLVSIGRMPNGYYTNEHRIMVSALLWTLVVDL